MNPADLAAFHQAVNLAQMGQRSEAYQQLRPLLNLTENQRDPNLLLWVAFTSPSFAESEWAVNLAASLDPSNPGVVSARQWLENERVRQPQIPVIQSVPAPSLDNSAVSMPVAGSTTSSDFVKANSRRKQRPLLLIGGLSVVAVIILSGFAVWMLVLNPSQQVTFQGQSASNAIPATPTPLTGDTYGAERPAALPAKPTEDGWVVIGDGSAPYTLHGVSCMSHDQCIAVGQNGRVMRTYNGGNSWFADAKMQIPWDLRGIDCPAPTTCYIVGSNGPGDNVLLRSVNGGLGWSPNTFPYIKRGIMGSISCANPYFCHEAYADFIQCNKFMTDINRTQLCVAGQDYNFKAVSCAGSSCIAVGDRGKTYYLNTLTDTQQIPKDVTSQDLKGVYCNSQLLCVAVGNGGTILISYDHGYSWKTNSSPTTQNLNSVMCSFRDICYVVGDQGTILVSKDYAKTWKIQNSGTTKALYSIACPDATSCIAVGENGVIVATTDLLRPAAKLAGPPGGRIFDNASTMLKEGNKPEWALFKAKLVYMDKLSTSRYDVYLWPADANNTSGVLVYSSKNRHLEKETGQINVKIVADADKDPGTMFLTTTLVE